MKRMTNGTAPAGRRRDATTASLTRRSFLASGLASGTAGLAAATFGAGPRPALSRARGGVPFGAAIQDEFFDDPAYRQAFLDECDMIVPMNELKFALIQSTRGRFDFDKGDRIVDFALENGRTSRGHTLAWWNTLPGWVEELTDGREAETVLVEHIERVVDHYRGRLTSWDVVNEAVVWDPFAGEGPFWDSPWLRLIGPRYIPLAFRTAARVDPGAELVINDFDLEFQGPRYDARRAIMLDIVRQLQDAGLKVDAVGLQAHLYAHHTVDIEALARFKADLEALGVALVVTELDVIDYEIPGGPEAQDAAAGRIVTDFLDAVLPGRPPLALVTWGITDRYSWVSDSMPRADGAPVRPHPLDADYEPKQWYETLRERLASAM